MICIFRHNDVVTLFLQYINVSNQEYQRSDGAVEGGDPEG